MLTLLRPSVFRSPCMMQVRFKKTKRKKGSSEPRTAEQEVARGKPVLTLQKRVGNPETPYKVATTIRHFMQKLTTSDKTQIRRRKDHQRFNLQRILSATGMTHDDAPFKAKQEGYVTPLTKLQDEASLPLPGVIRFPFAHTLHYKAFWGPPTVEEEPNQNEGSMVGCSVSFRVGDLQLKERQAVKLKAVVGARRYDAESDVVTIEADQFKERNQNAAYLGDLLDRLVCEVKK